MVTSPRCSLNYIHRYSECCAGDADWLSLPLAGCRCCFWLTVDSDRLCDLLAQLGFSHCDTEAVHWCVLKAEADYSAFERRTKPASSGYLTSVSECMLRAAKMEDIITECATFNKQALTERQLHLIHQICKILFNLYHCDHF